MASKNNKIHQLENSFRNIPRTRTRATNTSYSTALWGKAKRRLGTVAYIVVISISVTILTLKLIESLRL